MHARSRASILGILGITVLLFLTPQLRADSRLLWIKTVSPAGAWTFGAATDGDGNIYVAGVLKDDNTNDFGDGIGVRGDKNGRGALAKYSPNGKVLWVRTGPAWSAYRAVAVGPGGRVAVAGEIHGIDVAEFSKQVRVHGAYANNTSPLLLVYSTAGEPILAKVPIPTPSGQPKAPDSGGYGEAVTFDPKGNVYLGGRHWLTDWFSQKVKAELVYAPGRSLRGFASLFIVKYNPQGDAQWAKAVNGVDADVDGSWVSAMAADAEGNLWAAGGLYGDSRFRLDAGGPETRGLHAYTSFEANSNITPFLARLDSSGKVYWITVPSDGDAQGPFKRLRLDSSGIVRAWGYLSGRSLQFDSYTVPSEKIGGNMVVDVGSDGRILSFEGHSPEFSALYSTDPDLAWGIKLFNVTNTQAYYAFDALPGGNGDVLAYGMSYAPGTYTLAPGLQISSPGDYNWQVFKYRPEETAREGSFDRQATVGSNIGLFEVSSVVPGSLWLDNRKIAELRAGGYRLVEAASDFSHEFRMEYPDGTQETKVLPATKASRRALAFTQRPLAERTPRIELEKLKVLSALDSSPGVQDMRGFKTSPGAWSGDAHLFVGSTASGVLTLELPVDSGGNFRLVLSATRAPDFAIIRVAVDNRPLDPSIDLYGPAVQPTGPIDLGILTLSAGPHRIEFRVSGKNPSSRGTFFGLDYLQLLPN